MSYDFDHQPQGMSTGTKVVLGCAATAFLVFALICAGFVFVGFRAVDVAQQAVTEVLEEIKKQADDFAVRFEAQGYKRVTGQVVDISSDIKGPTVYTVQVFNLNADSDSSLAVMAQAAEINGTINGDLHFRGQALTIQPDAVITGNLHVEMAQMFENKGTVQGEVIQSEVEATDVELTDEAVIEEASDAPVLKPSPGDVIETRPPEPAMPESAEGDVESSDEEASNQEPEEKSDPSESE